MKITSEGTTPIAEILNPRGNLAKELEMTCKKASWLSLMCGYWLAYHHDNAERARRDEPYKLPPKVPNAARFNEALKNCGLFDRMATLKDGVVRPSWWSRNDWGWIFDYYYSGGLDRGIDDLKALLPQQNILAIEKEMLK